MSGRLGNFTLHGRGGEAIVVASSRRRVEAEDIAFALAARGRMGWQAIAKIRGVNEVDLRRACDEADRGRGATKALAVGLGSPRRPAEAAVAGASAQAALRTRASKPPKPPRAAARQMQVLAAIRDGASSHDQISTRLRIERRNSIAIVSLLRRKNLLRGEMGGWRPTPAGEAALRAWEADRG